MVSVGLEHTSEFFLVMFLDYFRFLVEFLDKWMKSAKSGQFRGSYAAA